MNEIVRNSFTFYLSWYESAKCMKDKDRLSFYDAIIKYSLFGEEQEVTEKAAPTYIAIKPTLTKSRTRALSGASGGKSKKQANEKQTENKTEANRKLDIDVDIDIENIPPISPQGDSASVSSQAKPRKRQSKPKPEKKPYGTFGNVMLTDEEYAKLRPEELRLIEELSGYIASKGARYTSHYATLLNWARRRAAETGGKGHENNSYTDEDLETVVEVL